MISTTQQPQFRFTQPPSKVLHLRNLPWECSEEELIQLCKPFGQVINTKCSVGANRNQAFVEFADVNQAISMVSYYASSSEPAQIRSKTVYLQYSNRQEIVNNKSLGDVPSNVLLVTFEGIEAGDVSIDVLHLVFSAFGFVHKIATFEKTAGFQGLVQFSDSEMASSARSALDGRGIPRYLLPDHVGNCHLHISFSAHVDLTVKFQSHRSRDYTSPNLPVAPSAINSTGQYGVGSDGKQKEPESNVLLASIENMQYGVTIEVLHMIFSAFGFVQKIAMFEKNAGLQALIQYQDVNTAITAKESLEGHCIYEGGYCKLHLAYSHHTDLSLKANDNRSRDYTLPDVGLLQLQHSGLGSQPSELAIPSTSTSLTQHQRAESAMTVSSEAMISGQQVSPSIYDTSFTPSMTQIGLASSTAAFSSRYTPAGPPPSQSVFLGSLGPNPGFGFAPPPAFQQFGHHSNHLSPIHRSSEFYM